MKKFLDLLEEVLEARRDLKSKLSDTPYDAGYFLYGDYENVEKLEGQLTVEFIELVKETSCILSN